MPESNTPIPANPKPDLFTTLRRLGPAGIVAGIASTLPPITGTALLVFVPKVAPWIRDHGTYAPFVVIALYWLLGGAMLLPTYGYSATCGWAFGSAVGAFTALTGIVGACMLNFLWARAVCQDRVTKLLNENPKSRAVYAALLGGSRLKTLGIVTLLRLPPNSPFALTNVLLAATKVPLMTVMAGTLVGMLPRTLIVVLAAAQMSQLDPDEKRSPWMWAFGIGSTIAVLAVLGFIARRALERATAAPSPEPHTPTPG